MTRGEVGMFDRLSVVSWCPFNRRWGRLEGVVPGAKVPGAMVREGLKGEFYVESRGLPGGGALGYQRIDWNPNRVFDGEYSCENVVRVCRSFWPVGAGPGAVGVVSGVRRAAAAMGIEDVDGKFWLRVSRFDLNADVVGEVGDFLAKVYRGGSQRFALYVERGKLNGFYLGKDPLVRVYQKVPGVVRVEFQSRPRAMRIEELVRFWEPGFSMSAEARVCWAEAYYRGAKWVGRFFAVCRDAIGLQPAVKMLPKDLRKKVVRVEVAGLERAVDAAYWTSYRSSDAVTEEQQVLEHELLDVAEVC